MDYDLTSRMRNALEKLRFECDYEDTHQEDEADNFILLSALAPGVGANTISKLLSLGLIESGMNRWHDKTGYRITSLGRNALEAKVSHKAKKTRPKLKTLPSRIGQPKGRLDK